MTTAAQDKEAIREVLAEYCFRLDNGRFDDMAALFTEDGTWDTAFGRATGRAAIAELARSLRSGGPQPRPRGIHLVTNVAIDLDEARARVRSNWIVATNSPAGPAIGSGGGYADDMVKTESGWRFLTRKIDRFIVP
jgi:3-phenylpropionate/cinnamic acid dioxygenase small subunit